MQPLSQPITGESASSTTYKARIIGDYIVERLDKHNADKVDENVVPPLMVAMHGPQGCGKTTLTDELQRYLSACQPSVRSAVLSLDDLYLPYQGLIDLSIRHPDNRLLSGRGLPGTHDLDLARSTLKSVLDCNRSDRPLELPIFDKSRNQGKGDRSSSTVSVETPIDVFILEGWSMGFQPLGEDELTQRYQEALSSQEASGPEHLKSAFLSHSLQSLLQVDEYLAAASKVLYPPFSLLIEIRPESYTYVYDWRRQQEHHMIAARGTGMSDSEVDAFVGRYMPGYELWSKCTEGEMGSRWKGNSLTLMYGKNREVLSVESV